LPCTWTCGTASAASRACWRSAGRSTKGLKFTLRAPRSSLLPVFGGDLDPMQAMHTRKLRVDGDKIEMMRNVPVVVDFVRGAKSVGSAA
jgi:putative sterol carrier protein